MALYISTSTIHGEGLYTDIPIPPNVMIGQVFIRVAFTGNFVFDFQETIYGKFTNHSTCPNSQVIVSKCGIELMSLTNINEDEEITANYFTLLEKFQYENSLFNSIAFWLEHK